MFTVFGFYKFQKLNNLKKNQKILNSVLINNNICGSIIISKEGLNGSISGKKNEIKNLIIKLKKIFDIKNFDSFNNSKSEFNPFHKPKVKIKKEVVPMDLKLDLEDVSDSKRPDCMPSKRFGFFGISLRRPIYVSIASIVLSD